MRTALKWIRFVGCLAGFFARAGFVRLIASDASDFRRRMLPVTQRHCQALVRLFGMRVRVNGDRRGLKSPHLLVSNHLSYLDVLVLFAEYPGVFVTSVEVRDTPFLGWLCRGAGCFFVERRSRPVVGAEIDAIADLLRQGFDVTLFPEGTSTNGEAVLPFKPTFLECAIRARAPVQPVCLRYVALDGKPLSRGDRDILFWYGGMTFFPHLRRLMRVREIGVELDILSPVATEQSDRKRVGSHAFAGISAAFRQSPLL